MTIAISGMSCDGCVRAVRTALKAVPGVQVDAVTIGSATVSYDEQRTSRETVVKAVEKAGYEPMASGVPVSPLMDHATHCRCGHAHGHAHSGTVANR